MQSKSLAGPTLVRVKQFCRLMSTILAFVIAAPVLAQGTGPGRPAFGAEYAAIGYTRTPEQNPVAKLAARLERGEVRLDFHPRRLHLDALLAALDIDPRSQTLVYSRTSLQAGLISAATPRAIYFDDSTYVAWIPGSTLLEIATVDDALGPVFYVLGGRDGARPDLRRHTGACLICHDNFNGTGGGTPRLMVKSVFTSIEGTPLSSPLDVTDATPLEDRWGGWYVTGHHGSTVHRGNLHVNGVEDLADLASRRRGNLSTLEGLGFFDTTLYPQATSDIVALLVLEHQAAVQNQITYVKFKAPSVLERMGESASAAAPSWEALPDRAQRALQPMVDGLVGQLLFAGSAPFGDRIAGTSGFERRFQERGPRDRAGRSLRDLDLERRLFRYPLSYLIYSAAFDALPAYARDYVYRALARVLEGEGGAAYAHLSADDRQAIRRILLDTKPDFVRYARNEASMPRSFESRVASPVPSNASR